ncbi:MAG: hypothetical protein Q9196_002470 [Gyalolechia fulgens]
MATPRRKIWCTHPISDHRGEISFTRVGDKCKITELSQIDLRKFERLHLNIQLPNSRIEGCWNQTGSLKDAVTVFAEEVEAQQAFAKAELAPWRPDIDVVVADTDPDGKVDRSSKLDWEIYAVLEPLEVIFNVRSKCGGQKLGISGAALLA